MADEVAALQVRLEATAARFEQDMRRATRAMDSATRKMERRADSLQAKMAGLSRVVGVNFGALAGALTAGALIRGFDNAIDKLDAIGKTADKIGLTTDSLQELRSAAEQTGVAAGTLDVAMQRFSRRTAEARAGTGEAKNALADLGVELNNADGSAKSLDDILDQVADGLARTENQSDRVALAMKLFDSEGVALVNTLGKGSKALDDMRKRAHEMNAVIAGDSVRAGEDLRTEIDLLSTAFSNTFVSAVGQAAQALNAFFNIGPKNQLATLQRDIALTDENIKSLQQSVLDGEYGRSTKERLEGFQTKFFELREKERELLAQINANAEIGVDPQDSVTLGGGGGGGGSKGGGGSSSTTKDALPNAIARTEERLRQLREEATLIGLTREQAERLSATYEAEAVERELLSAAQKDGTAVTAEEQLAIEALSAEYRNLILANVEAAEAAEKTAEAQRVFNDELTALINDGADAFAGLIDGTLKWDEALTQVLTTLTKILAQDAVNLYNGGSGGVLGAILQGVGAIGGAIGGISTVGGTSATGGGLLTGTGGIYAKGGVFDKGRETRFATGGVVTGPTRFPMDGGTGLMGEAGPEAILPLKRGPGGRLGVSASGGGGGNVINIGGDTFNIQEPGFTRQELDQLLDRREQRMFRRIGELNDSNPYWLKT